MINIIPVKGIPIVEKEDELWNSLINSLKPILLNDDILICAHTPWSRVRNLKYEIEKIIPTKEAISIAKKINKSPKKVQIILNESNEVIKIGRNVIIAENKAGIVCANAGIDESNAGIGFAIAVPPDPDALAKEIRTYINKELGKSIAVIISDTVGRALRRGAVNIAIGVSGISAMKSEIGKKDLFGYKMRVSEIAIADELASAAELLQGQTNEAFPFIIIRGYKIIHDGLHSARILNRPSPERLFK